MRFDGIEPPYRPMKQKNPELSARYLVALRSHLAHRSHGHGTDARALGRDVLAAGLDTLDLARMHERALTRLAATHDFRDVSNGLIKRTGDFFAEALFPVEKVHRATRESLTVMKERATMLSQNAKVLAASNRRLKREIVRRKAGEAAVHQGKSRYQTLLLQSQAMQGKLRTLARQIINAQENERRMISRELHDEVVQTLVGINVHLAALNHSAASGVRTLRARITRTQRLVEKSVNAVHQFARELRPAVLDDLGLIPALHAFMKPFALRKKLRITLTAFAGVEHLSNERRTVLYRVAQEALTNIGRHAHARKVDVSLHEISGGVRMDIHDDGVSFKVPDQFASRTRQRLGLVGMRERVEMVGGTLVIESAPGAGTTVRAEIPLSPETSR